jgi:hypothetical protein
MQVKATVIMTAFFVAVGALASCGDPTGIQALSNIDAQITLYALTGSAPNSPAAFNVSSPSATFVTPAFQFDVAFDLDPSNQIVIYSPRMLANQLTTVPKVGFQLSSQSFSQITQAPTTGYVYDTLMVVPPNKTVLVDASSSSCSFSLSGTSRRAKFTVDSVSLAKRALYVHVFSDPNCGFKDLVSDPETATPKG